jgi:hypothetical protein
MKFNEWKQHTLRILPPYVALKPFREILLHLWLHLPAVKKEQFTLKELQEDFESKSESSTNPIIKMEYHKCLQVLPYFLEKLVAAKLLVVDSKGIYQKSRNFAEFWYLISHVLSVEKLVKWGVYYLANRGKTFFTTENLVEILAPEDLRDIERNLSDLVIFENGEWKKVLEKQNDTWIIKKTYLYNQHPY